MRHVIDQSFPRVFEPSIQLVSETRSESSSSPGGEGTGDEENFLSLRGVLPQARYVGDDDIRFSSVAASPDQAEPGQLVVYRIGKECPSKLIAEALARGAAGIVSEQLLPCPLPQCIVGDVELACSQIAATELQRPDRKLLTIGVIGSAGKTSTALLIASLLRGAGVRTAYQTDLGECDGVIQTTGQEAVPDGASLVNWIAEAADCQCNAAIIELREDSARHAGYESIEFDLLVVTGRREADRDFGESALQCALERMTPEGVVIASADDPAVLRAVRDGCGRLVTYGVQKAADVSAKIIDQSGGMTTLLLSHDRMTAVMETPLCGSAMAANHAAAATLGLLIAQPLHEIAERLGQLREIPGRGQLVNRIDQPTIVLDRAGTTDRAVHALKTFRSMKRGRLWCVLAIDGADSPETLARYGRLLEQYADVAIVTANPPTKKKFLSMSHCVLDGVQQCAAMRLVADQRRALKWAIAEAGPADTILVLGATGGDSAHQRRESIAQLVRWVENDSPNVPSENRPEVLKMSDFA